MLRENSLIPAFHNPSYFFGPFVRSGALMNSFYSHRSVGSGSALVHTARQCRYATLIVVVGTVAIFGTYERSQSATIDNWNVNSGGNWNSGANWSTGSIPTIADDAIIGSIATSVTSPASITLDAVQTAYGLTLDPGPGKSIHVDQGGSAGNKLTLLSTDTSPD